MKYKEQILKLRDKGKSYNEISKLLNCSKSTVCYHCGEGQKIKHRSRAKKRNIHPYERKLYHFKDKPKKLKKKNTDIYTQNKLLYYKIRIFINRGGNMNNTNFTLEDIINKFGENPKCYLTGQQINIYDIKTYEFDHIIPRSRGGDNSLDNLGICIKSANRCKTNMTPDELINMCKQILEYQGYTITK